jgi:hypothetical protein
MKQKWTILFLVHAEDDKTRRYSNLLLQELSATNHAEHLRIFILRNTYRYNNEENMNAILSELIYNEVRQKKELHLVNDFGKINLGDPDTLSEIFDFVKNSTGEETRFLLVTWDHGYTFGIFNGTINKSVFDFELNSNKKHIAITNLKGAVKRLREERDQNKSLDTVIEEFKFNNRSDEKSIEYSDELLKDLALSDDTDMLTPEEIAQALKKSFTKKIDVLIMMNCWMQSVDTCYALQDTVEILVAAESTMDFIGYDYIDFINEICSDSKITNTHLSSRVISQIRSKYKKLNTEIAFNEIAVSAINLSEVTMLKNMMDNFSNSLSLAIRTNLLDVNKGRATSYEFTHEYLPNSGVYIYYIVDIYDVLTHFFKMRFISNKDFANLKDWLKTFLIAKTVGGNFTKETTALGIYFPNNSEYTRKSTYYYNFYYPKGPLKTRKKFALDSYWSIFIDDYNKRT